MALASKGRGELARQWRERESASPERTKVRMEPRHRNNLERKVPVVYYLCRNGNLEHPHFMEVAVSSPEGIYLRDVINRLNVLRGKGLAGLYSWSSKRCYRNGFVWHDLTEDDLIYPAHGHEYVLKGSEILQPSSTFAHDAVLDDSSTASSDGKDLRRLAPEDESALAQSKQKPRWGSFDLAEYRIPKSAAADAATQTDDRRGRPRPAPVAGRSDIPKPEEDEATTELGRDEVSPPPPSSSPETLETLIKTDGRRAVAPSVDAPGGASGLCSSGRARASAVLINLISCGAISVKDPDGVVIVPRNRPVLLGGAGWQARREAEHNEAEEAHIFPAVRLEDKEYFSGSLIETKNNTAHGAAEFATLKRSNSYNADRCSNLVESGDGEVEGTAKGKCIPRKGKSGTTCARKENGAAISRSSHGSKRITNADSAK